MVYFPLFTYTWGSFGQVDAWVDRYCIILRLAILWDMDAKGGPEEACCFFFVFWVVVSSIFYVHPYLGMIPNLTVVSNGLVQPPFFVRINCFVFSFCAAGTEIDVNVLT